MLNSILIQNIVLIEKLKIEMNSGLCILSGETGSGKSILLDSLSLAIGQRSNSRLLRQGTSQGLIIAEFNITNNLICQKILEENGIVNEENKSSLFLKRILYDNGTSKSFINDVPTSLNLLSQIGDSLLEIHGQHEQKGLLNPSYHKIILDQFAKSESLLEQVNKAFDIWNVIEKKIIAVNASKEQNEREKDYLIHVIKELELANVEIGEEEKLTNQRNLIINQEKISTLAQELNAEISDAINKFNSAQKLLIRNKTLGQNLESSIEGENKLEKLSEIIDQISVKGDDARDIIDEILNALEPGEMSLEEVEERLFLIRGFSRKFNIAIDELPQFLEETKEKLKIVENFEEVAEGLEEQRKSAEKNYLEKAQELSKIRHEHGLKLSQTVKKELAYLKMENVQFEIKITELSKENYSRDGIDTIRFIAATNKNSALDDISKIASGGELSRFMLALKVALSEVKSVPILIFDEIDTGIGGAVASAVGERLKLLSKKVQIMVVTHQPQIAAKADYHLQVRKENQGEATNTLVDVLDQNKREIEVARMLSGDKISDEAIAAAKKLIG